MRRFSSTAFLIALMGVVASGFGVSVSSSWAAANTHLAKAPQTAVPIPRAKPKVVRAGEDKVTADLNGQSLRSAQKGAMPLHPAPVEANAAPVHEATPQGSQDEMPLLRPLGPNLERFANADKITRKGWTSTLGLLPVPETKLSIPSPDVRLQERGVRLGAIYRF